MSQSPTPRRPSSRNLPPRVLFGAAYYHEYQP